MKAFTIIIVGCCALSLIFWLWICESLAAALGWPVDIMAVMMLIITTLTTGILTLWFDVWRRIRVWRRARRTRREDRERIPQARALALLEVAGRAHRELDRIAKDGGR